MTKLMPLPYSCDTADAHTARTPATLASRNVLPAADCDEREGPVVVAICKIPPPRTFGETHRKPRLGNRGLPPCHVLRPPHPDRQPPVTPPRCQEGRSLRNPG